MFKRWLSSAALLCLLGTALPICAADSKEAPAAPTVVVRIQSFDGLMKDFQTIAKLAGQEEQAKQIQGLINSKVGEKGLEGLDTKRPLGLYGTIGPAGVDSTFVGMIPVADEKAVLTLLEGMNLKAEKGPDGVYTIKKSEQVPPVDVYFRFANKYAYVTALDKAAIDKDKLLPPAQVLPADQVGTASLSVRLDLIPENLKDTALTQFELGLSQQKEAKGPNETEAQHKFKVAMLDAIYGQIATVLKDGHEINWRLDLADTDNDLAVKVSLSGKEGTALAKGIAALGQHKNLFASLPGSTSVMSLLVHVALPPKLRETMGPVIDEAFAKALSEEKDPSKRAVAEKLLKALSPSIKAGELDAAFDLRGPSANKLYTLAMGMKLKDGASIEKTVRDAVAEAPEKDRNKIKFDVDKAGSVSIHRAEMEADADTKKLLGDGPAYFAFRDDAVMVAAGENALPALKKALAVEPQVGKPLDFTISVARLAPLMTKEQPDAPKVAERVFAKHKDGDKIHFTIEGGKALTLRFEMKTALIEFFAELDKAKKGSEK